MTTLDIIRLVETDIPDSVFLQAARACCFNGSATGFCQSSQDKHTLPSPVFRLVQQLFPSVFYETPWMHPLILVAGEGGFVHSMIDNLNNYDKLTHG